MKYFGWPHVFYFFGGLGIVWYVLWLILCYNSPSSHPFITEEEKSYLAEKLPGISKQGVKGVHFI